MATKRKKSTVKDLSNGMAVLVRVSWEEHQALRKLAEAKGVSLAAWLRSQIHRAGKVPAEKRRPAPGRPAADA